MKKLIIFIILAMLVGCSSDKSPIDYDDPWTYSDNWYGVAQLIYPGPDDAPLFDSAAILDLTLDEKGNYYYSAYDIPRVPIPVVINEFKGKFYIFSESIKFIPEITDRPPRKPYILEGTYGFQLQGTQMTLKQILHPDSWPEIHTITLTQIDEGYVLFDQ
ncbi:MAG: hypothetical protein CVT49_06075 [candidate division Zixibacteria bacterium HGW-Zixibacteria-1]|nr:MAG: hypothetical protein CVT49_06075 [candidate division Zixibacteria bacterium HGW-Zixibacteria-1]